MKTENIRELPKEDFYCCVRLWRAFPVNIQTTLIYSTFIAFLCQIFFIFFLYLFILLVYFLYSFPVLSHLTLKFNRRTIISGYNTGGNLPTLTYSNSKSCGNRFSIAVLRELASQLLPKGNSWQTSSLSSN